MLKGPLSPEDVLRALDIDAPGASGNASGVVLEIGPQSYCRNCGTLQIIAGHFR